MSNGINNKNYGDYFNKLEQSLNREPSKKVPVACVEGRRAYNYRKRRVLRRRFIIGSVAVIFSVIALSCAIAFSSSDTKSKAESKSNDSSSSQSTIADETLQKAVYPKTDADTLKIGAEIDSAHAVVLDLSQNTIVAEKNSDERAYPASTTKVMTLLVAVEHIADLNDTFTMTYEITDPMYLAEATVAGFSAGEVINLKDMLYGIILPSGGDAALGIATKISGSEEAFVALMNEKADELGLKDTHFTNCTGLFDANHYTTVTDMAVILREAIKNSLCREILSTYKYKATPTEEHPEGLDFTSTLFSYMYGTEPEGADIKGGKTGFVNESGYCIASFGVSDSGKEYIAVTMEASSRWPAFYDQIALYTAYAGEASQ